MTTIDQINELRAELQSCLFTKEERAMAEAELAALMAQARVEEDQFARDVEAFLLTSNEVSIRGRGSTPPSIKLQRIRV